MSKTEKLAIEADMIVEGIAFKVNNEYIDVVNLRNIRYRSKYRKADLKLVASNMSDESIEKVTEILKKNHEFL